MGFSFLAVSALIVFISLAERREKVPARKSEMSLKLGVIAFLVVISVPSGFKFIAENGAGSFEFYFGIFILVLASIVIYSILTEHRRDDPKAVQIQKSLFKTDNIFNISAIAVILILTAIYAVFW